jgi:membrane protein HdeD
MTETTNPAGGYFRKLGIVLVVLGVIAILTPALAGSAVVIVIGFILMLAGSAAAVRGLQAAAMTEKILGLLLGVIAALSGIAIVVNPLLGLSFLAILLAGYFAVEGMSKIILSLRYRPTRGWGWLLASGVLSVLLGGLIWKQWPMSGLWAVGVLVGINLVSTGLALMTLASTLRRIVDRADFLKPAI